MIIAMSVALTGISLVPAVYWGPVMVGPSRLSSSIPPVLRPPPAPLWMVLSCALYFASPEYFAPTLFSVTGGMFRWIR
jgi:hypothetical protein